MNKKPMGPTCGGLFLNCLAISSFTLGGGYVMISLMKERFCDRLGWINQDDLTELMALGQSAPGALVINSCSIMGYRLLGLPGAICAALGTALPAIVLLMLVSVFYEFIRDNVYVSAAFRCMRGAVVAIVADAVISMAEPYFKNSNALYLAVMAMAFLLPVFLDVNVGIIIVFCALFGILFGSLQRRKESGK